MTVSPLCLRIMLLAYYSAEPAKYLVPEMTSSPGIEAQRWLQENGLVSKSLEATPRGDAWVKYILSTPLPEAKWVFPERTPS